MTLVPGNPGSWYSQAISASTKDFQMTPNHDTGSARTRPADSTEARLQRARELFYHGLPRLMGVEPREVSAERVTATLRVQPMHLNRNGRVGGGVLMAMADVMGAVGAVANRPPGYSGGTIESKTNFLAAAVGPELSAQSIPLHTGRTTSVWQTTIRNADGRTVAIVTQTQIALARANGPDSRA
jgi:1,4-dihydroxy-2-naphthoyl-CoA hydrolase